MEKEIIKRLAIASLTLIVFALAMSAIYFTLIKPKDGKIIYGDYTISSGHYGKIEKYDPSMTVEGYKGDMNNAYYITGKIRSKDNKDFTVITFNLYDKSNKLLGTAVAGLNELKKGTIYDFKALSLVDSSNMQRINHYKIRSIELGK